MAGTHPPVLDGTLQDQDPVPELSTLELQRVLGDRSAILLDARPAAEYAVSHIPGALSVPGKPGLSPAQYTADAGEVTRRYPDRKDLRTLRIRSGDPIIPAGALAKYDSKVEERFARDFSRLTDDWDLIREPEAVPIAGHFLFPDFLIRHRRIAGRQAWLEIVGFWTAEYLTEKLEQLRRARLPNFILCVDEQRNCSQADLPPGAHVIRYRRRVPAGLVLEQLALSHPLFSLSSPK